MALHVGAAWTLHVGAAWTLHAPGTPPLSPWPKIQFPPCRRRASRSAFRPPTTRRYWPRQSASRKLEGGTRAGVGEATQRKSGRRGARTGASRRHHRKSSLSPIYRARDCPSTCKLRRAGHSPRSAINGASRPQCPSLRARSLRTLKGQEAWTGRRSVPATTGLYLQTPAPPHHGSPKSFRHSELCGAGTPQPESRRPCFGCGGGG